MLRPTIPFADLALGALPASAATYSARPETPASGRFIARDIVWRCGSDACLGATDNGAPIALCQSLAKRAGRIGSFIVDGRAFEAAALDRCNSAAKAVPGSALATR